MLNNIGHIVWFASDAFHLEDPVFVLYAANLVHDCPELGILVKNHLADRAQSCHSFKPATGPRYRHMPTGRPVQRMVTTKAKIADRHHT